MRLCKLFQGVGGHWGLNVRYVLGVGGVEEGGARVLRTLHTFLWRKSSALGLILRLFYHIPSLRGRGGGFVRLGLILIFFWVEQKRVGNISILNFEG